MQATNHAGFAIAAAIEEDMIHVQVLTWLAGVTGIDQTAFHGSLIPRDLPSLEYERRKAGWGSENETIPLTMYNR